MKKWLVPVIVVSLLFVSYAPAVEAALAQRDEVKCDPFLNGLASFIIPGWGQWLNEERGKAVFHIAVGVGLIATPILLAGTPIALLAALGRLVWGGYSGYDAFMICVAKHDKAGK
ncbi:hypothetical protein LM602_08765 [Candidatus Acetothermia bacterium]|jgi:hypothetical protein|nr:hypothetical protein [Candidatus Acetothermia bacterium]MCI2432616.1 hypothetical protein [Candidatus Acetothermia bacterium]MCI2435949.1 hypothetical protein [Candidatus Acetothermia bacterium]